jgi:DNA-directed RNA polymerase specialized sigma24 family protein
LLPELDDTKPEPRTGTDLLGRIETKFRDLSAADTYLDLGPIGYPAYGRVRHVRKLLTHDTITHDQRDTLWRTIVTLSRTDYRSQLPRRAQRHTTGITDWQTVALGFAIPSLRHALHHKLGNPRREDRDDVQADLVQGFLTHLAKIDLGRRNICGRLIGAGIRQARRGIRKRYRDRLDHAGGMDQYAETVHESMVDVVGVWEAFHRLPLHPTDRRLIQMTRLQGHTLAEAADELGISLTAATSRRTRAEQRLAAHFRPPRTTTQRLPRSADQS